MILSANIAHFTKLVNKAFFQLPSGHGNRCYTQQALALFNLFNRQVMKRIVYFNDFNLSWDNKISLNFTIC